MVEREFRGADVNEYTAKEDEEEIPEVSDHKDVATAERSRTIRVIALLLYPLRAGPVRFLPSSTTD
jgi:hypothetical protein